MGTLSTLPAGQGGRTGAQCGHAKLAPAWYSEYSPMGYSEYSRRTERHALSMDATASPPFARMSLRAMCSALTVPDPCTHHAACTHTAHSTCTQAARGVYARSTRQPP